MEGRPFLLKSATLVVEQVRQGGVDTIFRRIRRFPPENSTEFILYYEGEKPAAEPGEDTVYEKGEWLISPKELEMDEDFNVYNS